MDVTFGLATAADDADIRRLLREQPVPGRVTVTFEREPSYFLGCGTMGHSCQVLVGRDAETGDLVGVACRAIRPMFVNGEAREVGYLSQLRVHRRYEGRWLLSRGFRVFRALHVDGRVTRYFTTITEDNHAARRLLVERPRRHFPVYRPLDRLLTLALVVRRPPAPRRPAPYEVSRASEADLGAIVAFLERHGSARQFFPVHTKDDFRESPTTRGFRIEDFLLATRGGRLVGVAGLWDQSAYKQTVVRGYSGALRWLRPLSVAGARLMGGHPLPRRGEAIRAVYLAFVCVAEDDPTVFRTLLRHAHDLAAQRGFAYLMVGLSARDPLLAVARESWHVAYPSLVFTVSYPDEDAHDELLDSRIPYVEIASL